MPIVLVVDDNQELREQLRALLVGIGCDVCVAVDGADAVRAVLRLRPNVVLMDLGMPVMDGLEAIQTIRARLGRAARWPHIIAFSGFDDGLVRRRAFGAGCNEYIVKPFDVRGALRAYALRRGFAPLG